LNDEIEKNINYKKEISKSKNKIKRVRIESLYIYIYIPNLFNKNKIKEQYLSNPLL
jgi:hypothetical protein